MKFCCSTYLGKHGNGECQEGERGIRNGARRPYSLSMFRKFRAGRGWESLPDRSGIRLTMVRGSTGLRYGRRVRMALKICGGNDDFVMPLHESCIKGFNLVQGDIDDRVSDRIRLGLLFHMICC